MVANSSTPALNVWYPALCGSPSSARIGMPREPPSSRSVIDDAEHLVAIRADLGVHLEIEDRDALRHDSLRTTRSLGREIVRADRSAVEALAEAELRGASPRSPPRAAGSRGTARRRIAPDRLPATCAPAPAAAWSAALRSARGRRCPSAARGRPRPRPPPRGSRSSDCARSSPACRSRPGFTATTLRKTFAGPAGAAPPAAAAAHRRDRRRNGASRRPSSDLSLNDQRAFVARAADGHVAAREQPTRPAGHEFLQIVAGGAHRRARLGPPGARQFAEPRDRLRGGIAEPGRFTTDQMCSAKRGADALAGRDALSASRSARRAPRDSGIATRCRTPCRTCRGRTANPPSPETVRKPCVRVDLLDARDRRHFEAGLAGIANRSSADRRRSPRGRRSILAASRYRSRFASCMNWTSPKFVKPSPPTESLEASMPVSISRPVRSCDRVAVFAAGQAAHGDASRDRRHSSWRSCSARRESTPPRAPLRIAGLRHALGRHAVRFERRRDLLPLLVAVAERCVVVSCSRLIPAIGEVCAMALETVLLEHRRGIGGGLVGAPNRLSDSEDKERARTECQLPLSAVGP